ncbi:phosphoribosyl-aminoimidazole-succinocarboxamide synthase [Piedraia hortae CBS 480.64]|uniref:Phosphoribosylaminoimidazole-succinocarboxamide synthase n=1 Tax=Piedraia hortae CBS 480.64 TaxID=1314780 RepID=A0A6A7C8Y9_9PEZI|nr:phosphoribosyl-aminoimidazole-succinocarboxamide synthase [Piedraia hortae CBS 480.64]
MSHQENHTSAITDAPLTTIELSYPKLASGKVREIFDIGSEKLLFVATDRISAYDAILKNGIPSKGIILTQLSAHWFKLLTVKFPKIKHHMLTTELPSSISQEEKSCLTGRCMQVRRLPVVPIESIVRGYLTGSAWVEYQAKGTVHGIQMPAGLKESEKLESPIWTPSTKAEAGANDENISPDMARDLVGVELGRRIEEASLKVYEFARDYAEERGILLADTKFEFAHDPDTGDLVLVDEVLTPDSSRFWAKEKYCVGQGQESFDKQFLRDWLVSSGQKGMSGVEMPNEIVKKTLEKYFEAYRLLTGRQDLRVWFNGEPIRD